MTIKDARRFKGNDGKSHFVQNIYSQIRIMENLPVHEVKAYRLSRSHEDFKAMITKDRNDFIIGIKKEDT